MVVIGIIVIVPPLLSYLFDMSVCIVCIVEHPLRVAQVRPKTAKVVVAYE